MSAAQARQSGEGKAARPRILVPVDYSTGSAEALRTAAALRRGETPFAPGAALDVVRALDLSAPSWLGEEAPRALALLRDREGERLRAFTAEVLGHGVAEVSTSVLDGEPRAAIPARAEGAALVVIGATGRLSARELVPGGVAEAVVRRSSAPVLTVKWFPALAALGEGRDLAMSEIVVATDFSSFSAQALPRAMAFAFAFGARLTALHVVPDRAMLESAGRLPFPLSEEIDRFYETELGWRRDELGRFLYDRLGAQRPVEVREVVRAGRPAEEIAAECRDVGASLLVLATHGKGGVLRALLGSVAERALRLAPCPVLTVRPIENGRAGAG
jgi:nucleotide-binding universal stress UspA family protein